MSKEKRVMLVRFGLALKCPRCHTSVDIDQWKVFANFDLGKDESPTPDMKPENYGLYVYGVCNFCAETIGKEGGDLAEATVGERLYTIEELDRVIEIQVGNFIQRQFGHNPKIPGKPEVM